MAEQHNMESPETNPDAGLMIDAPLAAEAMATEEAGHVHHHFVGVEDESVNTGLVMGIVLGVVVVVTGLVLFAFTITETTSQEIRQRVIAEAGYPDLREARAAAAARLTQYDDVDAASGIYRIPVDRAIDLMVNEHYQQQADGAFTDELKLLPSR